MLVRHVFPSDGEYTVTVTPIFGDNMSPAGFGSVPCEKLEILLDGERLQLMDWQGGGRAPAANCGGQPAGGRDAAGRQVPRHSSAAAAARPMRVRFKTTAGTAHGGRHVPADQPGAHSRPGSALRATHGPDGPDAGVHVLSARRDGADRGAVRRDAGRGLAEPPPDIRLPPVAPSRRQPTSDGRHASSRWTSRHRPNACARRSSRPWPPARSGVPRRRPKSTC